MHRNVNAEYVYPADLSAGSSNAIEVMEKTVGISDLLTMAEDEFIHLISRYMASDSPERIDSLKYDLRTGKLNRLEMAAAAQINSAKSVHRFRVDGLQDPEILYSTARDLYDIISGPADHRNTPVIKVNDFDTVSNQEFIRLSYRLILQRDADPSGIEFYGKALEKRKLYRSQILGMLRYSREGRSIKAKVRGVFFPGLLGKISRKIPFFALMIRPLASMMEIPFALTRFRIVLDLLRNNRHSTALLRTRQNLIEKQFLHIITSSNEKIKNLENQIRAMKGVKSESLSPTNNEKSNKTGEGISSADYNSFYALFHDHFRGSETTIQEKLAEYLLELKGCDVIKSDSPVLDLGCGRGEWIELLHENNIPSKGIDSNSIFTSELISRGFDILHGNALDILNGLPGESFGAVTAFHLVEHLDSDSFIELFHEVHRILKKHGLLILETPNPENLFVAATQFYMDPTHRNPIPPELLSFAAKEAGFTNIKVLRKNPVNNPPFNNRFQELIETYQDYAIIAQKL